MDISALLLLLLGMVFGTLAGWLAGSARARSEAGAQLADLKVALAGAQAEAANHGAQAAAACAQRDAALHQMHHVAETRREMSDEFRLISAESLDRQGEQVEKLAENRFQQTELLMRPVQESLAKLEEKIALVERERAAQREELRHQVATVHHTGEQLRHETQALVTALRKPQVRGAWGETQLKRVAEMAGMVEHCDFSTQGSATSTDGDLRRPDMTVHMTDGRVLYVDSKVPLAAFLEDADPDEDPARVQKTFGKHLITHMDQLSAKHYWDLGGNDAPELVILFLPGDGLLAHAMAAIPDLYERAAQRNLVIATPSTLIATLRAVEFGWRQVAMVEGAQEVRDVGVEMYRRLSAFAGKFTLIGSRLDSAAKAYNDAVGTFQSRVMPQVRRFESLHVTGGKECVEPAMSEESSRSLTLPELGAELGSLPEIAELVRTPDEESEEAPALSRRHLA